LISYNEHDEYIRGSDPQTGLIEFEEAAQAAKV
jgi:hypothetical protein